MQNAVPHHMGNGATKELMSIGWSSGMLGCHILSVRTAMAILGLSVREQQLQKLSCMPLRHHAYGWNSVAASMV